MTGKNKTHGGLLSKVHIFFPYRTVLEGYFIDGLHLPVQILSSEEVDCKLKPSSISLLMPSNRVCGASHGSSSSQKLSEKKTGFQTASKTSV